MNLHAKNLSGLSTLALCVISACLLSACGGGASGMVRTSPPLTPPPPPPPPPPPETFCPPPLTGDCVVDPPYTPTFDENRMQGGRQSDYALIMRSTSDSWLTLSGDYRFSGGTAVERGTLILGIHSTLESNTTVSPLGELWLGGTLRGDLSNHGRVLVGQIKIDPDSWSTDNVSRIEGNYQQSADGTLSFTLGRPLQITGRAQLDGGTAELRGEHVWDAQLGHTYYFPTTPSSQQLLHADGGVFGRFDNWSSPGLFIEGSLRYAPNDVFFDLTRISALGVMSKAAVGDALTLDAARNVDAAFLVSDTYAALPGATLTATQRQFLHSAAAIQHLDDYRQAARTFDSLSGHGHAAAVEALLQQATTSGSRASAHIDALLSGSPAGFWSAQPAMVSTSAGTFTDTQTTGYDQWLGDRLLFGGSFGWSQGNLRFDRSGGNARSQSPQWNAYLRRNGDNGSYVTGEVGYARHQLDLDRSIDLGEAVHGARSERNLDVTHAYVEAGRGVRVGDGQLTPFVAVSHATLRGDGFVEQGDSGFELIAQPSLHQRTSSDAGFRYARHWRWGEDRWMRLDLGARYQYLLGASDDMRAAFTGTPTIAFDLNGLPHARDNSWLEMSLTGGSDRWSWLLSYDHQADNKAVSLGVALGF